ncbi:MAG: NERD domain-containing protein, partial [Thermomicrobium sp.]|nr:NERD domain-containing protein [Thermomicrobium sp.]
MATMYPEHPRYCTFASDAERLVYLALKNMLPADCVVLYGVRLLVRDGRSEIDSEADFVILEPRCGVLVLEVKGGGIRRDRVTGQWYSIDRHGEEHPIDSPFEQARRTRYALTQKLREGPRTRQFDYPIRHAVLFPDVTIGRHWLGPDVVDEIVLDERALTSPHGAILQALGGSRPEGPLASAAVEALVEALSPSIEIRRPRLGRLVRFAEQEILHLTEQQFAILRVLGQQRRAKIVGPAGSGKTMLAIEKARQLVLQGMRVLLTCYNRNLSAWVSEQARVSLPDPNLLDGEDPSLLVTNYHGLVRRACERAGIRFDPPVGDPEAEERFWKEQAAELLMAALALIPAFRFDAVIVDEGQDFRAEWWVSLLDVLRDPDRGILYIFYDDDQSIYGESPEFPLPGEPFQLTEVLRNTQPIYERFRAFYRGSVDLVCRGPEGPDVEELPVTGSDLRPQLAALFRRLFGEEGIDPQ